MSWALCVVGGNNLALALRRQERDRERRIDAGLAWAHNPDAADLRAERAAQDTQLLTLPEEQLVELVAQMLAVRGSAGGWPAGRKAPPKQRTAWIIGARLLCWSACTFFTVVWADRCLLVLHCRCPHRAMCPCPSAHAHAWRWRPPPLAHTPAVQRRCSPIPGAAPTPCLCALPTLSTPSPSKSSFLSSPQSGGVQPEYLVRVGENLWRPLQAKEAADVESGDGVGHAGGKRRTLHAKRTTAPRVSRDTGGEEDCSCVVELVVAAGAKGDEIGGGGASESTAHTCADSGSSRPPLLPAVGGAAAASAAASTAAGTAADTADGEPAECSICFSSDTPATSVLLGCGHGGYCRRCACLVAARQPRLCPQCRAPIKGMVTLDPQQAGGAPIGGLARVAGV